MSHPGKGDSTDSAKSTAVNSYLVGINAYQTHVAGHLHGFGISSRPHANGAVQIKRLHPFFSLVQGALNGIKGINIPRQTIIQTVVAVIVVGVNGGPALLQIADVHALARTRRGRINGMTGIDHR